MMPRQGYTEAATLQCFRVKAARLHDIVEAVLALSKLQRCSISELPIILLLIIILNCLWVRLFLDSIRLLCLIQPDAQCHYFLTKCPPVFISVTCMATIWVT